MDGWKVVEYLNGDLRQIVWVPEASCDVEPEVMWVFNDVVTQFDVIHALLFEDGFLQDGLQDGVQLLSNVLQ